MEKEFIPYQQALALKELGFDESCFGYYDGNHNLQFMYNGIPEKFSEKMMGVSDSVWVGWISSPTFSQVFRWFREKYNLYISLNKYKSPDILIPILVYSHIYDENDNICITVGEYKTYEEAELECLVKLIDIVKK